MATQPQGFAAIPDSTSGGGGGMTGQQGQGACPPGETRVMGRCVQIQTSQQSGTALGVPPPERTQRYSAAERAGQAANRRAMTAGARYGNSFASQGYRPIADQGKHALYTMELQQRYGAFANPTWQYEERNGVLYRRPFANQTGRIAAQGGTGPQWEVAPDFVQRAYQNPQRRAWNAAHPDAASRPGGGRDQFLFDRFTGGLPVDPATGLRVNRAGELYDPKLFGTPGYTGGAIGQVGQPLNLTGLRAAGGTTSGVPVPALAQLQAGTGGGLQAAGGATLPQTGGGLQSGVPGAVPGRGRRGRRQEATPAAPAPAPGTPPPTGPQTGDPLQDEITNYLRQTLGAGGPFGAGETAAQRAALRAQTEGGVRRAREEAEFDLIRSGQAQSGAAGRVLGDIRRGAEQDYSRGATQIRLEHAQKNFEARMQALSGMAAQLQSARQYAIANAQTELERTRIAQNYDIALRNITLAQQQMRQQMSIFTASQAQQASQFGQTLGQQASQFGQTLGLQREQFDWTRTQGSCPVQQADGTVVTVPIPCAQLAGGFL